ncbi:hypothetical protein D3C86_2124900 [compost metagenome]
MRWLALVLACALAPAWAQEPKPAAKKAAKPQKAHAKATPEQIRKFNELQKKQEAKR